MENYVQVVPNSDGNFEINEVKNGVVGNRHLDRDYGRLTSATGTAWTLAKRRGVPLRINIHPGKPQAI